MPSAFDVLASDHEQVKRLLSQFEAAPAASGTNDSLLAARKKMAETLVIEESKREAVEAMYFWPAHSARRPICECGGDRGSGNTHWAANRPRRAEAGLPRGSERVSGDGPDGRKRRARAPRCRTGRAAGAR